jgi:hypothetical protein
MISYAFVLILTTFLYSGLIFSLIRLEHQASEARIFGRKLIGLGAFAVVIANRALLGGVWFLDVLLIVVAAIFYHRAAAEAETHEALPLLLAATAATGWLYLHPVLAPMQGGALAEELRGCYSNHRTIAGGIEMYLLDKNISPAKDEDRGKVQELERGWVKILTDGKYLQAPPVCGTAEYRVAFQGKDHTVTCTKHGTTKELKQKVRALPRTPSTPKQQRRTCHLNQITLSGAIEMYMLDKNKSAASMEELYRDWAGTLIAGGYLAEEPECDAAPRGKPEGRYIVRKDGESLDLRCPVHGTRQEMNAKHPND